jgi:hypothetical protein
MAGDKEPMSVTVERLRAIAKEHPLPDNVLDRLQCIRACGGDFETIGPNHEHFCPLFQESDTQKVVTCACGHKHVCDQVT